MAMIVIKCPNTGRAVATGVETDPHSFDILPDVGAALACPACGGRHVWFRSDARLAAYSPRLVRRTGQGARAMQAHV